MEREKLTALIDRVIGKKGILHTPSYWMQKVLHSVMDYADTASSKWVYALPDDGEYDLSSPIGKKLMEVIVNPTIFRLHMWVETQPPPLRMRRQIPLNVSDASYMVGVAFHSFECYSQRITNGKLEALRYIDVMGTIRIEDSKVIVQRSVKKYEVAATEFST